MQGGAARGQWLRARARRAKNGGPGAGQEGGFNNRDIRARAEMAAHLRGCGSDAKKKSAKVSRTFRRFHAHGLIAKIPRTRRWRVTHYGWRVMGAAIYLREQHFLQTHAYFARAA